MRKYLVTFHKVVPDDFGHDRRVVQRQSVVSAPCEVSAVALAQARFCEAAGLADWRMRADSCEVVVLARQAA
ncbi:hypothetical protein [Methylobacterium sp. SyP6R]|uniref:hypothetical protein n=1 Tax=Methylobacterium sp. SyP6R TaxID=2718876 RepID=UPI001F397F8F|nr:hypothetical protein [Methylobacterium sp. SyP6R]MCF4127622.1 hypothetical protein [Methylobacterium sp. SyP6R]